MQRLLIIDPAGGLTLEGLIEAQAQLGVEPDMVARALRDAVTEEFSRSLHADGAEPRTATPFTERTRGWLRAAIAKLRHVAQAVGEDPVIHLDEVARMAAVLVGWESLGVTRVTARPLPAPRRQGDQWRRAAKMMEGMATDFQQNAPVSAAAVALLAIQPDVAPPHVATMVGVGVSGEGAVVYLAEVSATSEGGEGERELLLLEANVDDMSGELLAATPDRLLVAGALDAWLTPVTMKKGRPALLVTALVALEKAAAVEEAIFIHTSTLGVRRTEVRRRAAERQMVEVQTPWGPVNVKVGFFGGREVNAAPEYEDCRAIAEREGVAVKTVYQAALGAYLQGG